MTTPRLTDRAALLAHRARAQDAGLFLHRVARSDIEERLAEVNRTFTAPALVTGFPEVWSGLLPQATVVSDTDTLNLQPGAHDLVVHALALHWADDPVGQLVQARRALRPDGLLLAVLFGGQTLHELRRVMAETETHQRGGLSPRVAPMGEVRDLGALLQRAGFALPVADTRALPVTYPDLRALVSDLRAMGETNALSKRDRHPLTRTDFALAEALYANHFATQDGRIRATFEFVFLTGWAPAETQPKALQPGSATQRLADALGVPEHGTGERPIGPSD
ncbi:MAG: methyltransferase domain-containing protein [Pseudomonadota bacterium]